jgi:hypothetical protein
MRSVGNQERMRAAARALRNTADEIEGFLRELPAMAPADFERREHKLTMQVAVAIQALSPNYHDWQPKVTNKEVRGED